MRRTRIIHMELSTRQPRRKAADGGGADQPITVSTKDEQRHRNPLKRARRFGAAR